MKICMTIRRGCPSEQQKAAFIDFFASILLETIPESEREKRSVAKRPFRQSQFSLPFKFIDFFVWHSSGARGEGGKKAYFTPMHRILLRKKNRRRRKMTFRKYGGDSKRILFRSVGKFFKGFSSARVLPKKQREFVLWRLPLWQRLISLADQPQNQLPDLCCVRRERKSFSFLSVNGCEFSHYFIGAGRVWIEWVRFFINRRCDVSGWNAIAAWKKRKVICF